MSNKLNIIFDYILESESGIADLLEADDPNYKENLDSILSNTEDSVSDFKTINTVTTVWGWQTIEEIEIPEDSFFDLTVYSMCKTKSWYWKIKSRAQRYTWVSRHEGWKVIMDGNRWLKHHWGKTNSSTQELRAAHYALPVVLDDKTIWINVNGRSWHELEWKVIYNLKQL